MKKRHKKTWTVLGLLLAAALFLGACGEGETTETAAPQPQTEAEKAPLTLADVEAGTVLTAGEREESVHVRADARGVPEEVTSDVRLSGINAAGQTSALFVRDAAALASIKNTEGDEEWVLDGDTLYMEYKGVDLRYEGTAQNEVPFGVKVTYFLDGAETAPEELAGKSGTVKIRFDYSNATGTGAGLVPAAAMTVVFLPEKTFSEVEIENGALMTVADQSAAVGLAFPGLSQSLQLKDYEPTKDAELPEFVEITAQVTDFKLAFTATVFSTDFFAELKDGDIDELLKIPDDMKELSDASKELADGTGELADGVKELADGLQEYFDGVHALRKGAKELKSGTSQLTDASAALCDGAAGLKDGLKQLNDSLKGVDVSGLAALSELDLSALTAQLGQVDLAALADQLEPVIGKEQADALRSLQTALGGLGEAAAQMEGAAAAAGELAGTLGALKSGVGELYKGSKQLSRGINDYTAGVSAVDEGAGALYDGAKELDKAAGEIRDGLDELKDGTTELRDGVKEFDEEGIQELTKIAGEELRTVLTDLKSLRGNAAGYQAFSARELPAGTKGSVRFIIETAEIR